MNDRNTVVFALGEKALSEALGCSSETVELLRNDGVLELQGELWEIGAAQDYLRDAAWADQLWH